MNIMELNQALKMVGNPNILVNMVSQRVRQLGQGHKALVAADVRMSYMDIAIREIALGKIEYELPTSNAALAPSAKPRKKK